MFVLKSSSGDLRTFLSRENVWLSVVFAFCKCLDQFSFLSNNNPRYSTVPEEGICLLLGKIGGDWPWLNVDRL